jgi:hypothetical protein
MILAGVSEIIRDRNDFEYSLSPVLWPLKRNWILLVDAWFEELMIATCPYLRTVFIDNGNEFFEGLSNITTSGFCSTADAPPQLMCWAIFLKLESTIFALVAKTKSSCVGAHSARHLEEELIAIRPPPREVRPQEIKIEVSRSSGF